MEWLNQLNTEQRRAVEADGGPLCIIAGPGTGKTKTLTARIAYLLTHKNSKPQEILALTFTNKAAREMHHRLKSLKLTTDLPEILTFHALCYKLLLAHHNKPIVCINEQDRMVLLKELRKSAELTKLTTRELAFMISYAKNLPTDSTLEDPAIAKLLAAYNDALQKAGLYDFDDLLRQIYWLLRENHLQTHYHSILVDEFQDTNALQYELLTLLQTNGDMCVIGDPLQSIYGFRGASSDVFERFKADFPHAQSISLTTNYRSAPQVVELANAIFPDAAPLTAHHAQASGTVRVVEVLNEYAEATWIINHIEQAVGGSDFLRSHQVDQTNSASQTFRDFAILYRTHHVAKTFQRMLAESGIPYQITGEDSPYEKPSIHAIIQLLRYLADPSEETRASVSALQALKKLSTHQVDHQLKELATHNEQPLSELVYLVADAFCLRHPDLTQFTSTLMRFDGRGLKAYLTYLDTLNENDFYDPAADAVSVMTIHAAKGLEFTHVFLLAAEEGILPHRRHGKETDIEEEKRLLYVAATRAQTQLDLLYTKQRAGESAHPSRFIEAIPSAILPHEQDDAMAMQQRRYQKRLAKRQQGSLFDL